MAVNYGTYYFDGINFAQATALYTDAALTTLAADGFYSQNGIVRQQLNGILLNSQPCSECSVPCGSGISANFSGNGHFNADVDLANSTGATVIYYYMGAQIPDGVLVTYNSVFYNRLTCKNNHNGQVIGEQNGTVVDYSGLNNQPGTATNPTFVGDRNNTQNPVGTFNNVTEYNYVDPVGYQALGTTRNFSVVNAQVGTAVGTGSPVFTQVIPKTVGSVTNCNVQIFAPLAGTVFRWQIFCPTALPSFQGSALQNTTSCAAGAATYYFVRNATGTTTPFTIDTNTTPEIGNFVFEDANGSTYVNDTALIKYIIVGGTTALGIRNGVVVSSGSCSGSPSLTSFNASISQTFNQICGPGATPAAADQTYYHSGSAALPIAGDTVFTTSAGTTALAAGYYYLSGGGGSNTYFEITGNQGFVTNVTSCIPE